MGSSHTSPNKDLKALSASTIPMRQQLLVLDSQLRVKSASASFYNASELVPGQTVGKDLANLGNGWRIPALLTQLQAGDFDDFEMEQEFPALGRRTVLVCAHRQLDRDDPSGTILVFIRDITGQKQKELEAIALATRNRAILDSIGNAVVVIDLDGRITFMNLIAEKLTGWVQNDAMEKYLKDIFHITNDSSQTVQSIVASAISERALIGLSNPTILIGLDGGEWPIDGSAAPIVDADGLSGVVLAFRDVSNRCEEEQNLKVSVRYRRLFEAAHDGILILDAVTAKVLDVNPFMGRLLGYPREHFLEKELWEIGVFKDADISKKAMTKLQRAGHIRYEDLPLEHKDGRHIPVEFVSNVYREGRRNVIQCNIRDITDRKRLATDLAKATEQAKTANQSKSDFLGRHIDHPQVRRHGIGFDHQQAVGEAAGRRRHGHVRDWSWKHLHTEA